MLCGDAFFLYSQAARYILLLITSSVLVYADISGAQTALFENTIFFMITYKNGIFMRGHKNCTGYTVHTHTLDKCLSKKLRACVYKT